MCRSPFRTQSPASAAAFSAPPPAAPTLQDDACVAHQTCALLPQPSHSRPFRGPTHYLLQPPGIQLLSTGLVAHALQHQRGPVALRVRLGSRAIVGVGQRHHLRLVWAGKGSGVWSAGAQRRQDQPEQQQQVTRSTPTANQRHREPAACGSSLSQHCPAQHRRTSGLGGSSGRKLSGSTDCTRSQ